MALRGSASVEKQLQEWSAELQSPRLPQDDGFDWG
jgi:hypothetical protein